MGLRHHHGLRRRVPASAGEASRGLGAGGSEALAAGTIQPRARRNRAAGNKSPGKEQAMSDSMIDQVKRQYGAVAASDLSSEHLGVRAVAEAFGYSPSELASIPAEAN